MRKRDSRSFEQPEAERISLTADFLFSCSVCGGDRIYLHQTCSWLKRSANIHGVLRSCVGGVEDMTECPGLRHWELE